jgi:dodecin
VTCDELRRGIPAGVHGMRAKGGRRDGEKHNSPRTEGSMSVAKVSEVSSTSTKSFEDAVQQGLARASKTLRNIRSAWIKEQHVRLDNGRIVEYQVNMMLTFVLDD